MTNITEDFVSYETAKLLKEKGFDEPCVYVYLHDGSEDIWDADEEDIACQKPTLQMAMKWLRKVYDLHIIAYPWRANKEERATHWCCQVYKSFNLLGYEKYTNETPKSYEEACEAAIKYCLENLI